MEELDAILSKYTSEVTNHLRGATFVAVNFEGETLYSKSFGQRTFDTTEDDSLLTDSLLWIASLTKLVTSVACMIAVEKGLVTLDENVREIVPELEDLELLVGFEEGGTPRKPILKKVTAPVSLRQLLSHQSGFAYDQLSPDLQEWSKYNKRTEWTMSGTMGGYTHPLIFEPGAGWVYGCGMDWAGRVVEIVSKQSLESFMQTHIFTPLGMDSTTFHPENMPTYALRQQTLAFRDRATGELGPGRNPWACPARDCCGGVGLYSTADDYAKLLASLLNPDSSILPEKSIKEMFTGQLDNERNFNEIIHGKSRAHLGQTWPLGAKGTFGLGGSITLEDFEGRRAKGSMNWSGMPGLHAWVDRETGVAGLLTTQVLPPGDSMVTVCLLELERALYKIV
ncbi:beta-lactamase class C [Hyaloscypha sp. PMI_1271]|nr:beta-lactamase class C [Hyaloscypha sp. PMI_1271]